jgi:hypothetical protein
MEEGTKWWERRRKNEKRWGGGKEMVKQEKGKL